MRLFLALCVIACTAGGALLLTGCGGEDSLNLNDSSNIPPPLTVTARFDPSNGIIPFPHNILFNGSEDGTLNIPVTNPDNPADPTLALNTLDGFSTLTPWTTSFSNALNPATVLPGQTVRLFQVETSPQGAVIRVVKELIGQTEFTALVPSTDSSQMTLVIVPLQPLQAQTTYMAVLTHDIHSISGGTSIADITFGFLKHPAPLITANGSSVFPTLTSEQAQSLEPLRQLTQTMLAAASTQGIPASAITLAWTATTQSIVPALRQVRDNATAAPAALANTGQTTATLGLAGAAQIVIGQITVPYFLDINNPLNSWWQAAGNTHLTRLNPTPIASGTLTIPMLVTVPNSELLGIPRPAAGWPIVIFQHGITRNRMDLLAVADSLAQAGFAAIAIDNPLHGLTDPTDPKTGAFHASNTPFPNDQEPTFDLDLANNASHEPGADGLPDPSGLHFYSPARLLNSRDNVRQGVANLFTLSKTIASLRLDGIPLFNERALYFAGHSLGGMIGTIFTALQPNIKAVSLAMPGGGIAKLLSGSPTFGPSIDAGLAQNGLIRGTAQYEQFFVAGQTAIDAGDPINYASLALNPPPLHLIEIVGGAGSLPDQVIPNQVADAPLSGTEPLIRALGLVALHTSTENNQGIRGAVRFTAGNHGSILDPTENAAVTVEIQSQIADFFAHEGRALHITDPTFILP